MNFDLNRWVSLFSILALLIFAISIPFRWIDHDESMLAEHAYWWYKLGYYRSVLNYGLPNGWHTIQYSTHKAFVLLGAGMIDIAGWSLTALRMIPLFFAAALALIITRYSKIEFAEFPRASAWVLAVLFFQAMFLTAAYRYRPETMLMTFGFLNFWMLERYLHTDQKKFLLLGGLAAGLSIFTHLNGAAYAGAGGLLLLSYRKFGPSLIYGVIGLVVGSLYFHNLLGPGDLEAFLTQYLENPNLSESDWHWYSPIVKMLSEHLRFFHSAREVSTSLLLLIALIGSWKTLKQKATTLLRYFLFTILVLGALTRQTPIYYILYLPYIAIIIAVHLGRWPTFNAKLKYATLFFLIGFIVTNSIYSFNLISRRVDTKARTAEMMASIPEDSSILGPTGLLFNGIEENYEIRSFKAFKFCVRNYPDYSDTYEGLLQFLSDTRPDYLILDHIRYNQDEFMDFRDPANLAVGDTLGIYGVTEVHGDWTLLQCFD